MAGLEMHEAASVGDYDTIEMCLRSGKYDVNAKDPEWKNKTALHWACQRGYSDVIRLLLECGAKGTSRMDMGWTPAHCAAEAGKLSALRTLHSAGVPIDKPDKYGDTPRRIAYIYGLTECVQFLKIAERERRERQGEEALGEEEEISEMSEDEEGEEEEEEEEEEETVCEEEVRSRGKT